ncbi:hypothetical protein KVG90_21625 [Klebsiella pneumoniae]|uniref:hypothetical protein n=1 Tax=Klebsiella pneumoniae TaxID=573 RepID=UPI00217DF48B|nr:hypothetical protein [Klebsiella pneumoniae]MCS6411423.1 hypothetical protein [Klebsiella pneumoniae]
MQNQQLSDVKGKELVAAGHAFAKAIGMDTPLIEIAKMVSEMASRLDCALVRGDELEKQRDALAAENAILKSGIGFFSYGTDSGFEEHDSAEKAIAAADSDIDYYRGDACDGWSEETDRTVWGVIMQRATVTGLRAVTEDDNCDPSIEEWCDYTLLPNIETPATDAYLNSVRAEGIHFSANRMLTAWESGFIDDTPAQVLDISGAVLSALEFLPSASPEEFKRDYADQVRADIAELLRAGKDGE